MVPRGARQESQSACSDDQKRQHIHSNSRQSNAFLQEDVIILEVSRNPASLLQALQKNQSLQSLQSALSQAGLYPHLPGGAATFVSVHQYQSVKLATASLDLQKRHIITSKSMESTVSDVIASLPKKERVRIKTRTVIDHLELLSRDQNRCIKTSHTFISLSSESESSQRIARTASTTDGNSRSKFRPREHQTS